ncbi:hypothetical protein PG984_005488 [Apiospora sp. TS-2023a]
MAVNPENYRLEVNHENDRYDACIDDLNVFLQSWLFFCLINVVIRTDEPLLYVCDLVRSERPEKQTTPFITTRYLEEKISQWHEWMNKKHPAQAKARLVQIGLVLEFARQVVRENFGKEEGDDLRIIDPKVSLSIMVLGETLSAVKTSILREMGETILGWEGDDLSGWGFPSCVTADMPGSCAYTTRALLRQIGPNATLLLAASKHVASHQGDEYGCSIVECRYIKASPPVRINSSAADTATTREYQPRCSCVRNGKPRCKLIGPDMRAVFEVLRGHDISFPVFQVKRTTNEETIVVVEDWGPRQRHSTFATVSHVWSQGLGNPKSNTVQYVHPPIYGRLKASSTITDTDMCSECQLRFITNVLDGISKSMTKKNPMVPPCRFFWLDTFAIPVTDEAKPETVPTDFYDLRHQSIRKIYSVFEASSHSIVIDDDLYSSQNSNFMRHDLIAAVKLLTSSWMRRLWTLQEAFLSEEICFTEQTKAGKLPFKKGQYPGRGLDQLIQDLSPKRGPGSPTIMRTSLAEVLKRHLFDNLMVRSPHRKRLALCSLAHYSNTTLEDTTRHRDPKTRQAVYQRRERMKDFLNLISKHYPGSIPAGIIFLPTERLRLPGFGWAPATWASGDNEDYPYPLSRMEHTTKLVSEGLIVRYPGVLLHCEELAAVVNNEMDHGFSFPVDQELNEWYRVDLINENKLPRIDQIGAGRSNRNANYMLAVIISRPRPKERLPEIGLLVEIYQSRRRRHEKQTLDETLFYSRTLCRVRVSRISPVSWKEPRDQVIGERTKDDQLWCVDDYSSFQTLDEELAPKSWIRPVIIDKDSKSKSFIGRGILNAAGPAAGTPPLDSLNPHKQNELGDHRSSTLLGGWEDFLNSWPQKDF